MSINNSISSKPDIINNHPVLNRRLQSNFGHTMLKKHIRRSNTKIIVNPLSDIANPRRTRIRKNTTRRHIRNAALQNNTIQTLAPHRLPTTITIIKINIRPRRVIIRPINHRIKRRINIPSLHRLITKRLTIITQTSRNLTM